MKTDTFIKRFQNKSILDTGATISKEFKSFAVCFKNYLKRALPTADIKSFNMGHYSVSAFLKFPSGTIIYISYDVPRGDRPIDVDRCDAHGGVLYRIAENETDYRGGANNFTSLKRIADIERLAR